jgi:hypothetical protein
MRRQASGGATGRGVHRVHDNYQAKVRPPVSPPGQEEVNDAGDLVLWEHVGRLDRPGYAAGWDWNRAWYRRNGLELDRNPSPPARSGGPDMQGVESTAKAVQAALE